MKKLKLENMALSDRVQSNAQDMVRTEEQLQQFELDLVISQEKHRTCQQEVRTRPSISLSSSLRRNTAPVNRRYVLVLPSFYRHLTRATLHPPLSTVQPVSVCPSSGQCVFVLQVNNRDQAILKLQAELDTSQQKYTGALEEVSAPPVSVTLVVAPIGTPPVSAHLSELHLAMLHLSMLHQSVLHPSWLHLSSSTCQCWICHGSTCQCSTSHGSTYQCSTGQFSTCHGSTCHPPPVSA